MEQWGSSGVPGALGARLGTGRAAWLCPCPAVALGKAGSVVLKCSRSVVAMSLVDPAALQNSAVRLLVAFIVHEIFKLCRC